MLEGITILNQVEILQWRPHAIFACIMCFILLCVFAITVAVGACIDRGKLICVFGILGFALFMIILLSIVNSQPSIPTGRYEYTVIIDDSVSFTDLYEKYNIVEQNGQLWTLRDKKAEE